MRTSLVIRTDGRMDAGNDNTHSALGLRGENYIAGVWYFLFQETHIKIVDFNQLYLE